MTIIEATTNSQEYGRLLPILLDMERETPGELCVRQFLADAGAQAQAARRQAVEATVDHGNTWENMGKSPFKVVPSDVNMSL